MGSRTYAILDVPPAVYDHVRKLLAAVGMYDHAFRDRPGGGEVIDMHGLALGREGRGQELDPMPVRFLRADAGPDGVELDLHPGAAAIAYGEDGKPYLRLELGVRDAGSVLQFIRHAYARTGLEIVPVGHDCASQGCHADPTQATPEGQPYCDEHAPHRASSELLERPQRRIATEEGVRFYLRSAYGLEPDDIEEAIRRHPYTIQRAGADGRTVEQVAVDIARRWREGSARIRLELAAEPPTLTDAAYRELLNLLMVSDPEPVPLDVLKALADREWNRRGHDGGWIDAYHRHKQPEPIKALEPGA